MNPLQSIVAAGTHLWVDSVDPDELATYKPLGATGATSNPVIIADLIRTGRFDNTLKDLLDEGDDEHVAWHLTDRLVRDAQDTFHDVWTATKGNDGYVSFELDPLLEDPELNLPHDQRVARYLQLGQQWALKPDGTPHDNRMIKVPATPAGIDALQGLAAAGVTLNVTLIFTQRQYEAARDAVWSGAQQRESLDTFKSVYSIFISRVDVYTAKHCPDLPADAQGQVGLVNAKRLWADNQSFWADLPTPLDQQIIFASTGAKLEGDPEDRYIAALVGSDIQTNPPETNAAIQQSGNVYKKTIDRMPPQPVLDGIDQGVDMQALEDTLMREGIAKFANPHKQLLELIATKRAELTTA